MKTALTAGLLLTPSGMVEHGVVIIEGVEIAAAGSRSHIEIPAGAPVEDFGDAVIAPGLIDIHVHGGAGHDVMDASPSAMAAFETHLARQGVTAYLPTTVTAPVEATLAALERLGKAIELKTQGRARPLGVHLEGPFISTAKCGVHPVKDIRPPSLELFDRFWAASQETVRMVTLAPELDGAEAFVRQLTARRVRVSLGHSNAGTAATTAAIAAGASHATHTFNAMRALDHRDPGVLGAALSDDRLSADIIADGIHVAPELLKLFFRSKGAERAVLITDAISATGKPDGRYRLGGIEVEVKDSRCTHDGRLAGSVLTLDQAVRNMMAFAGCDLEQALAMASANPARALGLERKRGAIARGMEADLVVMTRSGKVKQTYIAGVAATG